MLSVDNNVNDPFSTQGYNRYSYALNNPLKYTDPDGEHPILVAILIGAMVNLIIQDYSGNVNSAGDALLAIGIGAAAGAAGYGLGLAANVLVGSALVGSSIPTAFSSGMGFAYGAATGFAGGAIGGFIGNAALTAMNNLAFGTNNNVLLAGLKGAAFGGSLGFIMGGVAGINQVKVFNKEFGMKLNVWDGTTHFPEELFINDLTASINSVLSESPANLSTKGPNSPFNEVVKAFKKGSSGALPGNTRRPYNELIDVNTIDEGWKIYGSQTARTQIKVGHRYIDLTVSIQNRANEVVNVWSTPKQYNGYNITMEIRGVIGNNWVASIEFGNDIYFRNLIYNIITGNGF
jgi:hypothetical protein